MPGEKDNSWMNKNICFNCDFIFLVFIKSFISNQLFFGSSQLSPSSVIQAKRFQWKREFINRCGTIIAQSILKSICILCPGKRENLAKEVIFIAMFIACLSQSQPNFYACGKHLQLWLGRVWTHQMDRSSQKPVLYVHLGCLPMAGFSNRNFYTAVSPKAITLCLSWYNTANSALRYFYFKK